MTKWLIYTVLVGATPFLIRLLIFLFSKKLPLDYIINEVDMVTFGLIINVSNINELDDRIDMSKHTKTIYTGVSTVAILIFGVILGVAYVADLDKTNLFDIGKIKVYSAILSLVSLAFSYSIYHGQTVEQNG